MVADCDGAESTMYDSGTGVSSDSYAGGTDVTDKDAFILSNDMVGAIDGNLAALGHVDGDGEAANFADSGGLINFVLDADENPVSGATIDCAAGYCPAYYRADVEGFSFVDSEGMQQESTGTTGLAILPGAPITTYTVGHAEKTFDSQTMGSLPGVALFVRMIEPSE